MIEEPPEAIRKAFPRTWYYPKWKLLVWYPRGVLNQAFVDQIFDFLEMEEHIQDAPFDRYADLSGLSGIRLGMYHLLQAARRRREVKQPVRSAIFANEPLSFEVAQTYEHLMEGGMIEVRAFERREEVAAFLEVPVEALEIPGGP